MKQDAYYSTLETWKNRMEDIVANATDELTYRKKGNGMETDSSL